MDSQFRKKKHLGQHFLTDNNIAEKIAASLTLLGSEYQDVLEVGPGEGMLTKHLIQKQGINLTLVEFDKELIGGLKNSFNNKTRIIEADFLKTDLSSLFTGQFGLTGNFPYNISSQILVKAVDNRSQIPELTGMFQKELAVRIASPPGSKLYGRISVLVQIFYDVELLFHVSKNVFSPPPNVESAVIRLLRKPDFELPCNEKFLFTILKITFGQRRKMLRNTLAQLGKPLNAIDEKILNTRPEQLSAADFVELATLLSENNN